MDWPVQKAFLGLTLRPGKQKQRRQQLKAESKRPLIFFASGRLLNIQYITQPYNGAHSKLLATSTRNASQALPFHTDSRCISQSSKWKQRNVNFSYCFMYSAVIYPWPDWHSCFEICSLPAYDGACVMGPQLRRHVPLSPALLLDLPPSNTPWCFWQLYHHDLCKAKTSEPGIKAPGTKAAWWRGKREWVRTCPDIPSIQSCKCRLAKVTLTAEGQWWNYSPSAGLAGNAQWVLCQYRKICPHRYLILSHISQYGIHFWWCFFFFKRHIYHAVWFIHAHAHRYREISNQHIWALRARIWDCLHT